MATGRMLHKKIGLNKPVHNLSSDTCRLAYTWTIPHLDRDGRLHADPGVLKSLVFPRRSDITVKQMAGFIKEWADAGLIVWYEAQGDVWLWFPTFKADQIGLRYDREPPSFAPPPDEGRMVAGTLPEGCRKTSGKGTEKKKAVKHLHGEKVLLTNESYKTLCEKYTKEVTDLYIEKVNEYCVNHGKHYDSYAGAVATFIKNDKERNTFKGPTKVAGWKCPACEKINNNTMSFCTYCKEERLEKKV